jgi:hypothetical protein
MIVAHCFYAAHDTKHAPSRAESMRSQCVSVWIKFVE